MKKETIEKIKNEIQSGDQDTLAMALGAEGRGDKGRGS